MRVLFELIGCIGVAYLIASAVTRFRNRQEASRSERRDQEEARALEPEPERPALPPADRTLATIQPGDIVQMMNEDFLVEGAASLAGVGQLYRVMDGGKEHFLFVSDNEPRWLARVVGNAVGPTASTMVHEGRSHALSWTREAAAAVRGSLTLPGRSLKVAEFVGGMSHVIVFNGESGEVVLAGRSLPAAIFEILPGS